MDELLYSDVSISRANFDSCPVFVALLLESMLKVWPCGKLVSTNSGTSVGFIPWVAIKVLDASVVLIVLEYNECAQLSQQQLCSNKRSKVKERLVQPIRREKNMGKARRG